MSNKNNLITLTAKCSDLFLVEERQSLIENAEFLNQEIKVQKNRDGDLVGAGIYGFFYRDQLIYVGKFKNGNKGTPFGGNVAKTRWWTHLASMTMRGRKVSVSKTSLKELRSMGIASSLAVILDPTVEDHMAKDRGCSSGLRRLLFALEHWEYFEHADMGSLLNLFSFCYVRIPYSNEDPSVVRKKVGRAEDGVIKALKPRCNKETPIEEARVNVPVEEFISYAKRELCW